MHAVIMPEMIQSCGMHPKQVLSISENEITRSNLNCETWVQKRSCLIIKKWHRGTKEAGF
jgi:hypothetical protein